MKKGFTLIELLAVITLLGLVALIAVPAVSKSIKNKKEELYEDQIEFIISSAKLWATDNKLELSELLDGETKTITLKDLISNGYIDDEIKNPLTDEVFPTCVEIKIKRVSNNYEYTVTNLDCEIETTTTTTKAPVIGVNFNTDSWETIVEAVQNGDASAYKVGDTKTIDMGTLGTHTVRISNTTPCDGSLQSETACGFVIEFADIITTHVMNDTDTNVGGWPATKMRTYLNNDIYNALPADLKNGIINTKVISGYGTYGSSNFETTDKLYLLSTAEVWPSGQVYDTATDSTITRQLYYYTLSTSTRIKQNDGSNAVWLLRSAYHYDYSPNFYAVDSRGSYEYIVPTNTSGVSPAFRLK